MAQAESVVWLIPPLRVSFWRVLRRSMRRSFTREQLWRTNNRESLRKTFLSKDSRLFWSLTSHRRHIRGMLARQARFPNVRWITLRSAREVDRFVAGLGRTPTH